MSSEKMYWEQDTLQYIADVMSRNSFDIILPELHFNNNKTFAPSVQARYDKICNNVLQIPATEDQSINKQMIPFNGCSSVKQYLTNIPINVAKHLQGQIQIVWCINLQRISALNQCI